jgi:hypothetical protein
LGASKAPKRIAIARTGQVSNPVNAKAAIQSQYGGTDDIFAKMWLLK